MGASFQLAAFRRCPTRRKISYRFKHTLQMFIF